MEPHEVDRRPVREGQNTSHAVMAQRREAKDSLDDFPTPPWATRAICNQLLRHDVWLANDSVREPCANRGFMVLALQDYFRLVVAEDVHDYGVGFGVADYLFGVRMALVDWTFMNPPFRLAEEFIARAIDTSHRGVVVLVRTSFLEGVGRYQRLFSKRPPWAVFHSSERIPMVKGRYDPKASTATSYSWIVWRNDTLDQLPVQWIAPCRKELELPTDVLGWQGWSAAA